MGKPTKLNVLHAADISTSSAHRAEQLAEHTGLVLGERSSEN